MEARKLRKDESVRLWPPSLDLREDNGDLILHAELEGAAEAVEISTDAGALILVVEGDGDEPRRSSRLTLPFPVSASPVVRRPSPQVLEIRIPIPGGP